MPFARRSNASLVANEKTVIYAACTSRFAVCAPPSPVPCVGFPQQMTPVPNRSYTTRALHGRRVRYAACAHSERGSLFGLIAETTPLPRPGFLGNPPPRFDWIGRPEQTNLRIDSPGLAGAVDLRDLWNQQTPFAIGDEFRPLFLQRLKDSLAAWDMRDGKADWTAPALAANANMFLDDFILFDVLKPITDSSHLEIEKSTLNGKAYETGGGRTVNANVIDVLVTGWPIAIVNPCAAERPVPPSLARRLFHISQRPTPNC